VRVLARLRAERGLTALVVSHDLQLLEPAFDGVFAMRAGVVEAAGSPAEVLREENLRGIFEDERVRARRVEGRTVVWCE